MNAQAEQNLEDELTVDIRDGYLGGEYPLHGKFRLRSFSNVISFIGRAMGEEPEYDVAKGPRSPATTENPVFTLGVVESDSQPAEADRVVKYNDQYYAVRPETGYQWNKKAFLLLYQLFEMTVLEVTRGACSKAESCSSQHKDGRETLGSASPDFALPGTGRKFTSCSLAGTRSSG